jgi:cysteine desulfurase/selenocysteine lyase
MLDVAKIRSDFPILAKNIHNKPLVYLDNAATTQKPKQVLDSVYDYYTNKNSNIHRGVHLLSEQASEIYESVRDTVKDFINAGSSKEIVFTQSTTDSINLVAQTFGKMIVKKDDEIIITQMEHHSNLLPWQSLCEEKGAKLKVIPLDNNCSISVGELESHITDRTRLIAVTYISNVLGNLNPVEEIIEKAHSQNVPVLIDAAQAIQHLPVDVQKLDCDFLVFSGHKMYAETGIGVLYGKEKWLEKMPPYRLGGGMISKVNIEKTTYAEPPFKFEAGTGNIGGVISLGAAIEYIKQIGLNPIIEYEKKLMSFAAEKIGQIDGLILYGNFPERFGSISFNLENTHHYDAGMILDKLGIAVRTGTHCAEPLMEHLEIDGTIRASFALYNTVEEINMLADGLLKVRSMI